MSHNMNMIKHRKKQQLAKGLNICKYNDACIQVLRYEKQIDRMVYELYGLTEEEIRIVEGQE